MNPDEYWSPWENEVSSFKEVQDLIQDIFDKWSKRESVFAWRGHVNAAWALHSSLYRRLLLSSTTKKAPRETHLDEEEDNILAKVHKWGLHMGMHGRLSIFNQLALLQHYGSPTRLIDVTFNPYIGLWFSVEKKWNNGKPVHEDKDGRLFAIDVTGRLINEDEARRAWTDNLKRPWPRPPSSPPTPEKKKWQQEVFAWRPPHLDSRIAAQNGGFIFGGVPAATPQYPKSPEPTAAWWKVDEVRQATSLALRPHKLDPKRGGVSSGAVYTIRIRAKAKEEIRRRLEGLFGYTHATLFRDFTGFASFGTPELKSRP